MYNVEIRWCEGYFYISTHVLLIHNYLSISKALKVSKRETKRVILEIPDAPVFYPTAEEFRDPLSYIKS